MTKKLFILSTKAGNKDFDEFEKEIIKVYEENHRIHEFEILKTQYKNHGTEAARDFIKENPEDKIVIVCGGDGTLGEVSNVMYKSKAALGLVPMGTANDFAKNFSYKDFKIEDTFEPKIKPIDIIEVNNKICINVCSLGFDTHVLESTYDILEKEPELGHKAFYKAVLKEVTNITFEDLELDLNLVNGEKIKYKDTIVVSALCNGSYYGSGFNPAPNGKLDDGILNLIAVKKQGLFTLIPLILRYKFGKHLSNKTVTEHLVKSGRIKSEKTFTANLDGEIFYSKEIDFIIREKGINWAYF